MCSSVFGLNKSDTDSAVSKCKSKYNLMLHSFPLNWDIGHSYKGHCRGAAGWANNHLQDYDKEPFICHGGHTCYWGTAENGPRYMRTTVNIISQSRKEIMENIDALFNFVFTGKGTFYFVNSRKLLFGPCLLQWLGTYFNRSRYILATVLV